MSRSFLKKEELQAFIKDHPKKQLFAEMRDALRALETAKLNAGICGYDNSNDSLEAIGTLLELIARELCSLDPESESN